MRFKFKLQRTADFFDHKETAKKMEIARVKSYLNEIEEKYRSLEEENKNTFKMHSEPQSISVGWLKVRQDRVEANLDSMTKLKSESEEANKVLEHKKNELRKISQKKKALEKVKEKKKAEFNLERSRSEQKALDENYQILKQIKE